MLIKSIENDEFNHSTEPVNASTTINWLNITWTIYITPNGGSYDFTTVDTASVANYIWESDNFIAAFSPVYRSWNDQLYRSLLTYNKNTWELVNSNGWGTYSNWPASVYYDNWHIYINTNWDWVNRKYDLDIEEWTVTLSNWYYTSWVVATNWPITYNWFEYKSQITTPWSFYVKHLMRVDKQ